MKLRRRRDGQGLTSWLPERLEPGPWVVMAGAAALAFAAGWLVAAQILFPAATEAGDGPVVEVPSLEGTTLDEARSRLEDRGLSARVTFRPRSAASDSGRVLAQRPPAGQMARQGAAVELVVSGGGGTVRVPGLRGLPRDRARSILGALGLETTSRQEPSAVRSGEVVGTEPEAGARVRVPSTVMLVVSQGPEVARVPEVVGRHVDDVALILRDAGLGLGAVEFDSDAPAAPGRVVGQSPPPDFALRRGGEVSVRVAGSRGDWTRPPPPNTGAAPDTLDPSAALDTAGAGRGGVP